MINQTKKGLVSGMGDLREELFDFLHCHVFWDIGRSFHSTHRTYNIKKIQEMINSIILITFLISASTVNFALYYKAHLDYSKYRKNRQDSCYQHVIQVTSSVK